MSFARWATDEDHAESAAERVRGPFDRAAHKLEVARREAMAAADELKRAPDAREYVLELLRISVGLNNVERSCLESSSIRTQRVHDGAKKSERPNTLERWCFCGLLDGEPHLAGAHGPRKLTPDEEPAL